jgi:arginyl-tRNA synthetase
MLDMRASSAVYVMYAYARASAVLRRDGMGKDDAFVDAQRAHDELRAAHQSGRGGARAAGAAGAV